MLLCWCNCWRPRPFARLILLIQGALNWMQEKGGGNETRE